MGAAVGRGLGLRWTLFGAFLKLYARASIARAAWAHAQSLSSYSLYKSVLRAVLRRVSHSVSLACRKRPAAGLSAVSLAVSLAVLLAVSFLRPGSSANEPAGRPDGLAGCRRRRAAHRATGRAGWRVGALGRWRRRRRRAAGRPMCAGVFLNPSGTPPLFLVV